VWCSGEENLLEKTTAVLVIEDDADTRSTLCAALEDEGYQVLEAPDGVQGLEYLRTHPDLLVVLLDWLMPGMDGVQMLDAIASDAPVARRHAFILMSASADKPDFLSLTLPPDLTVTILGKPFSLDSLFNAVTAAVAQLMNEAGQDDEPRQSP
jgi:CheY-like chemotaxis protein